MSANDVAAGSRIIVALDTPDPTIAVGWAEALRGEVGLVKVGLELYSAAGPDLVRDLVGRGLRVFLDLKLHDIPNTVARSVNAIARLGVELTTLHASGGRGMLEAAAAARDQAPGGLRLLAVTVLTSLDAEALEELGHQGTPEERAVTLATLAASAGIDGAVCSPAEVARLRATCPPGFLLVTPGVRPAGHSADDQARIATPADAVQRGADYIVVGRPITRDPDPRAAARRVADSLPADGRPRGAA